MWIGHRKEIWKLLFLALALRRERINELWVMCVIYLQKDGATLLVGAW